MKKLLLILLGVFVTTQCITAQKLKVIYETDIGNDIDDAFALDIICKYMDEGKIDLLGVSTHKKGEKICSFVDAMLTWYGYPRIPIAKSATPVFREEGNDYPGAVVDQKNEKGKPLYKPSQKEKKYMYSVDFYRKTLSKQPDNSVYIVSVGFGTNLAALLASKPDRYSDLTGRELVAKKVKALSIMMGNNKNHKHAEYNVICDLENMQKTISQWPGEIIQNPFEVGEKILYPQGIIDDKLSWAEHHPLIKAYHTHNPRLHNQCTWDLLSVICIVNPEMFNISERGTISVDNKGITRFTPSAAGKHRVLITDAVQDKSLQQFIIDTTSRKPKKFK